MRDSIDRFQRFETLVSRPGGSYSKFSKPVIPVSPVTVTVTVTFRRARRASERFSFHSSWKLVERARRGIFPPSSLIFLLSVSLPGTTDATRVAGT